MGEVGVGGVDGPAFEFVPLHAGVAIDIKSKTSVMAFTRGPDLARLTLTRLGARTPRLPLRRPSAAVVVDLSDGPLYRAPHCRGPIVLCGLERG